MEEKFENVALAITVEPRQIFDTGNVEVGDIFTVRDYLGAINDDGSYSYSIPKNGVITSISSTGFTLAMADTTRVYSIDDLVAKKYYITGHAKHLE